MMQFMAGQTLWYSMSTKGGWGWPKNVRDAPAVFVGSSVSGKRAYIDVLHFDGSSHRTFVMPKYLKKRETMGRQA